MMMALRLRHILWRCLKILLILVLAVEAISFLAMTVQNYVSYGHVFSHVPVRYDADALFLMMDDNPPSDFNSVSTDQKLNRTIWMFGGSTVRCEAHRDRNTTLPAFLSKFLNEKAKPLNFTVLNFGENGFNSVLESKYLQKAFIEVTPAPEIVVFYDGANDSFQYAEYRERVAHIGYRRLRAFVESYRQSWLGLFKPFNAAIHASYTNEFIDRIRMYHDVVKPDSPELGSMVESAVRRYDHLAKVVNAYGARFVLIWQPMLWVEDCTPPENVKSGERGTFIDKNRFPDLEMSVRSTYKALEDALQHKPYFVSFRNVLCGRTAPLFWPDGIHLRDEGNDIAAREIGVLLIDRFPVELSGLEAKP
jgi:hypothetical protein